LVNESVFGRFDLMSGSLTREFFRVVIFNLERRNFIVTKIKQSLAFKPRTVFGKLAA